MFKDRYDAAQQLALRLQEYKDKNDVIIIAIPRGALEIGYVLAQDLHAPLDVIFAKKIGAPGNPELAIGTVSMDQVLLAPEYKNDPRIAEYVEREVKKLRALLSERIKKYRPDKPPLNVKDKVVILVDDGVATGNTLKLAIQLIQEQKPKKLIVAVPVGPLSTIERLKRKADEVVCLLMPGGFIGISQFYSRFPQVEDEQAVELLNRANR